MNEPESLAKNSAIDEFFQGFIAKCLPPSSYHLPILVVDDEPRLRDAVKEILSLAGYQVECAATGREALTLLAEHDFSLVLLDLNLLLAIIETPPFCDMRWPPVLSR
jgi:PleD family two-component response regulator